MTPWSKRRDVLTHQGVDSTDSFAFSTRALPLGGEKGTDVQGSMQPVVHATYHLSLLSLCTVYSLSSHPPHFFPQHLRATTSRKPSWTDLLLALQTNPTQSLESNPYSFSPHPILCSPNTTSSQHVVPLAQDTVPLSTTFPRGDGSALQQETEAESCPAAFLSSRLRVRPGPGLGTTLV